MATNTVGLAIEQVCLCCKETTKGTAVYPTAAAELVIGAGSVDINQQPGYSNSEEVANSLDVLDRFQDQVGAGTFKIPTYVRPSGTAGTAPMADVLYESLMGVGTNVVGTSEAYSQATTKPSFTLWVKKGHTVFFGTGACVDSGAFNFTNKGACKIDFSGGFMQMGWAGTCSAASATANGTGTGYLVDDAENYAEGDTTIHVDTGEGSCLVGDTVTFAGDATVYFVATGWTENGDNDLVIASPGLTKALLDGVAMTITGNRLITAVDGQKFTAGGRVRIAADNNSKAGYTISSVSGNVLSMAEAVTCANAAVIAGYLDETLTAGGSPLESKSTTITFDAVAINLKSLSLTISSPVVYQVDEITTSGYPEAYIEDTRNIEGSADLLFRENDMGLFYDGLNNVSVAAVITLGTAAGSICTIGLPQTELEVPNVTTSKPTISLTSKFTAIGSTGEDSATITFT